MPARLTDCSANWHHRESGCKNGSPHCFCRPGMERMELDKSMLYVGKQQKAKIQSFCISCAKSSLIEEFCLWGTDFVYDYPPNLAQTETKAMPQENECFFVG